MTSPEAPPLDPPEVPGLGRMLAILSEGLTAPGGRYFPHPGDLLWWLYHQDPRLRPLETRVEGDAFAVLSETDVAVFARPGAARGPLLRRCVARAGSGLEVGWVSCDDEEAGSLLREMGMGPSPRTEGGACYTRPVALEEWPTPARFVVRPLAGEHEAWARREASHAAFASTMDPGEHHARYLRFMRSPAYGRARDLVAVTPEGRVAAFMVWWPDSHSRIAQLEPVGTHPDYQRRGLGRALLGAGMRDMARSGMTAVRVGTDDDRPGAIAFYKALGLRRTMAFRWWSAR